VDEEHRVPNGLEGRVRDDDEEEAAEGGQHRACFGRSDIEEPKENGSHDGDGRILDAAGGIFHLPQGCRAAGGCTRTGCTGDLTPLLFSYEPLSAMRLPAVTLLVLLALPLGPTGCIKKMLTDGEIESTRRAADSFDTIGDYELAHSATQAGLVQFEGMHALAPDNADALFLLVKGWTGYGYGFIEDEMEAAQDAGDDDMADYQRKRARMAYDRAVFYGLRALAQKTDGFDQAKKSAQTLSKWLSDHFTSQNDVPNLFWTGNAWVARVDLMKGDDDEGPAFVAELYVGAAILERAMAIDPSFEHFAALVALGAYHARTNLAELAQARQLFDVALARTESKSLIVPLLYATKYACMVSDGALYKDMLERVLLAQDPDPQQRLSNAIAKRRAKRWLGKRRAKEECGIDLIAPSPPATPARSP
jgi:TRAP transporter TatT component family protein